MPLQYPNLYYERMAKGQALFPNQKTEGTDVKKAQINRFRPVEWIRGLFSKGNERKERATTQHTRRGQGTAIIYNSEAYIKIPPFPLRYIDIGEMARMEPVMRTCINTLGQEVFRRGLRWTPSFTSKCKRCEAEFHGPVPIDRCPTCDPAPKDVYSRLADVFQGISQGADEQALMELVDDDMGSAQPTHLFLYSGEQTQLDILKSILGRDPELKTAEAKDWKKTVLGQEETIVKRKGEKLTAKAIELQPEDLQKLDRWFDKYSRVALLAKVDGVYHPAWVYSLTTTGTHDISLIEHPEPKKYLNAERMFKKCNDAGQSLLEVLRSCEDDVNTFDDAYLILRKEYDLDENGEILQGRVVEILRGVPALMRKVVDPYNRAGGLYRCCLKKSCNYTFMVGYSSDGNNSKNKSQSVSEFEPIYNDSEEKCPQCGGKTYDALYVQLIVEGGPVEHGYIDGEVIHWQKYSPGPAFGYPPVLTLWYVAGALLYQNTYIRDYYMSRQTPKAIIGVSTSNPNSFWTYWKKVVDALLKDRHFIPVMMVESDGSSKGTVTKVDLMNSLTEMEYTEGREELRQRIAAFYGVSSTFLDDSGKEGGGMVSAGIQPIVTSRAIEKTHLIYNTIVLPQIVEALGVKDWKLEVVPSENRDLLQQEQHRQLKYTNAQILANMGFKIGMDANGELTQWMPEISDAQLQQLLDLINQRMQLEQQAKQQVEMAKMGLDAQGKPNQPPGGAGSDGKPRKLGGPNSGVPTDRKPAWKTSQGTPSGTTKDIKKMEPGEHTAGVVTDDEGEWARAGFPNIDPYELEIGILVELEHTKLEDTEASRAVAMKIARDHLAEIPDYYTRLALMEEEALRDWAPAGKVVKGSTGMSQPTTTSAEKTLPAATSHGRTKTPVGNRAQSGSNFVPGGDKGGTNQYVDPKTGKVFDSKQALGGAMRKRDPSSKSEDVPLYSHNDVDAQMAQLDAQIRQLLIVLKMQQRSPVGLVTSQPMHTTDPSSK